MKLERVFPGPQDARGRVPFCYTHGREVAALSFAVGVAVGFLIGWMF